jgi:hypothetical protein
MFEKLREESRKVVPAVVYFFLSLTLFKLTFGLWMAELGVRTVSFGEILIGSLVLGKVMMVVDHLPFLNVFPGRPLIFNTLWRAFVYAAAAFLYRAVDRLIPLAVEHGLRPGIERLYGHVSGPHFWTVHVWVFVLFFIFAAGRDLVAQVGRERLRDIFFGR